MSELHVRCATPTMSNPGDEVSSYADDKLSSIDSTESQSDRRALEEDPIDWWGTYVPLESWIPPKSESIPTFQGSSDWNHIRLYKFRAELPHYEYRSDSMGKKEKNMYVTELLRTPNFLRGQHSRTIKGPVELGGATSEDITKCHQSGDGFNNSPDPYDCGWDDPTVDGAAAVHEFSAPDSYNCGWEDGTTAPEELRSLEMVRNAISEDITASHGSVPDSMTLIDDPYDCGWDGAIAPSNQLSMPDPYDCGWEDQTAAPNEVIMPGKFVGYVLLHTSTNQVIGSDNDEPEEGEYYLGSQHLITQPQSRLAALSNLMRNEVLQEPIPADDVYQSEWDDPMVNRAVDTEASAMNVSSEERLNPSQDEGINQPSCQEGRDSTDDTAHLSHSIDNETALSKSSTANPYDCGWEDDASLPEKTTTTEIAPMIHMDVGAGLCDDHNCRDISGSFDEHGDYMDDVDMENTLPDIQKDSTEDLYDCGGTIQWITQLSGVPEVGERSYRLTSLPATSRRSSSPADPNVFEEAEESMRRAIQRLNSIGHNDFDRYIHSIVTPAVTRVPDPRPAITFMANRSLFGAYADAKDR
ncbi:uncharacterized protein F5891DRAFT_1196376 [Suillus fuscotomentosus]|uniref:Uncharacterized protein n=1 Tax=Suillus fuscotomentosus TaxID=1912939 RepID=A0AAD4HFF7_9AGAM|nr:uncharacterized protein F5891DRAFT_1196376 [Suillus fuscotomentosus]KAG1893519.1 hypothetical protein F5891DRAFT_1196376 [Suillus fuscotomentosus]